VLPLTTTHRSTQSRPTAENQCVFAECGARIEAAGRSNVTASRFEGVDEPSSQRGDIQTQRMVRLHDLAHPHTAAALQTQAVKR
jgi:hypothetical protein